MPKIYVKDTTYFLRWPAKWDKVILSVVKLKKYRRTDNKINWKKARKDGKLDKLPEFLSDNQISKRYSDLKRKQYRLKNKKRIEYEDIYSKTHREKINKIIKVVPEKIKKENKVKLKKNILSNEEWNLLQKLTSKYRKSKKTVDWTAVSKDKRFKKLPIQDIVYLRKYHGIKLRNNRPDVLEKRRKDALDYKKKNLKKYNKGQQERIKAKRKAIRNYVIREIEKTGDNFIG